MDFFLIFCGLFFVFFGFFWIFCGFFGVVFLIFSRVVWQEAYSIHELLGVKYQKDWKEGSKEV